MRTDSPRESSHGQRRDLFPPAVQDVSQETRAGPRVPAKTKHHALRDGERLGRTAEGLAVIHVTADDETGEVSALAVLARHGEIPEAFEEEIRGL
jgi:hypothetical protein